jgi:phosphoribosylformylglycinamidine synthase subunit PurL
VNIALPDGADPFVSLFSESAGRVLVSVSLGHRQAFEALVHEHEVPITVLGVTGGDWFKVKGQFEVPLAELREAWSGTLPKLFE